MSIQMNMPLSQAVLRQIRHVPQRRPPLRYASWGLRSCRVELGAEIREHGAERVAKCAHGSNQGHSNQPSDQPVFQGGDAIFVVPELRKFRFHVELLVS